MTTTHTQMRKLVAAAALAASAVGCSQSDIDITNPNSALASAVARDPTALQLLATGLFTDQRGTRTAMITNTGILGREMYTFTPNEGRNTTHFLVGITVARHAEARSHRLRQRQLGRRVRRAPRHLQLQEHDQRQHLAERGAEGGVARLGRDDRSADAARDHRHARYARRDRRESRRIRSISRRS